MKIKIVQMNSKTGLIQENLDFMLREIIKARNEADCVVFPELCVSGSLIMDNFKREDVINELLKANKKLIKASKDLLVIWGNIDYEVDELLDTGFVAYGGELLFKSNKQFNATSNLADKKQYFSHHQHKKLRTFKFNDKKCTVVLNHDFILHNYDKVDLVFHLNSHYYRQQDNFNSKTSFVSNSNTTIISVNGVGLVNSGKHIVMLDGQSFIYHQQQFHVLQPLVQETQTIDLNHFDENEATDCSLFEMLIHTLKEVDQELFSFKPKWVVGLSGGLDSSVTAALLTIALGKERVLGLNLATKHNSSTTKDNAKHLAETLGIDYKSFNLMPLVEATQTVIPDKIEGLVLENVQARLRGHVLMTQASLVGGVVSNNTNKIEAALGYGTLYGDTAGALGILNDCTKMDVVALAQMINNHFKQEVIPYNLLPRVTDSGLRWEFAPSAELKDHQVDPMKWGYHDALIERLLREHNALQNILNEYENKKMLSGPLGVYMIDYGLDNPQTFIDDLLWVLNTMNRNVFKRIQGVPMLVVSDCALGLDYKENQMPLILTQKLTQQINSIKEVVK